jgi:hypothetical protein
LAITVDRRQVCSIKFSMESGAVARPGFHGEIASSCRRLALPHPFTRDFSMYESCK